MFFGNQDVSKPYKIFGITNINSQLHYSFHLVKQNYDTFQSGNEGNSASRFAGQSSISSAQYFNRPDELTYGKYFSDW